jgi:hypothetical protein
MPISLPSRVRPPIAARESFLFKAILAGSAVWLAAFVLISAELSLRPRYLSAGQDEAALLLMAAVSFR